MIPVTRTFLPDLSEYHELLKEIWDTGWLTNRGKLVRELESKLIDYLEVNNILITNNGTIPLQIAIEALEIKGEVITTPFSYIATTSAILWQKCKPRFVDIHPLYLTIDENLIERNITSATSGILATHVFGNPCNVDYLQRLGDKYNLPIIYDAAHCFGVKYKNKSIFNFGDISTCSFHATKIFHTGEGGALFCKDQTLFDKVFYMHNFGHRGPLDFYGLGINAKISELQVAMGLAILPYMHRIIAERRRICEVYKNRLIDCPLQFLELREGTEWNFSYFPIIFNASQDLLRVQEFLNKQNIFPRRYFYPSLSTLDFVGGKDLTPIANRISECILCLPLYVGLTDENIDCITSSIQQVLN